MNPDNGISLLIKRIEESLALDLSSNFVSILERELDDIESLLYALKGAGVVGLFQTGEVETSNVKGGPTDLVYGFAVNREKLKKFKRGIQSSGKEYPVRYNPKEMTISYRGQEVSIPPETKLSALCQFMFTQKINTPVSWDIVYEEMAGGAPSDKVKNRKTVYDAVLSVNRRFRKTFPEYILFDWRGRSVVRVR